MITIRALSDRVLLALINHPDTPEPLRLAAGGELNRRTLERIRGGN